jgi:hypothetical protein
LSKIITQVENYRDAALLQDCDSGVRLLCKYLNWESDLDQLIQEFHSSSSSSSHSVNNSTKTTNQQALNSNATRLKKSTTTILTTPSSATRSAATKPVKNSGRNVPPPAALKTTTTTTTPAKGMNKVDVHLSSFFTNIEREALTKNWRVKFSLPPLLQVIERKATPQQPSSVVVESTTKNVDQLPSSSLQQPQVSRGGGGGGGDTDNICFDNMTCELIEPPLLSQIKSDSVAWFRIGFCNETSFKDRDKRDCDFLGLYHHHSKDNNNNNNNELIPLSEDYCFSYNSPVTKELDKEIEDRDKFGEKMRKQIIDGTYNNKMSVVDDDGPEPVKLSARHEVFQLPYVSRAVRVVIPSFSTISSNNNNNNNDRTKSKMAAVSSTKNMTSPLHKNTTSSNNQRADANSVVMELRFVDSITHDVLARWELAIHGTR